MRSITLAMALEAGWWTCPNPCATIPVQHSDVYGVANSPCDLFIDSQPVTAYRTTFDKKRQRTADALPWQWLNGGKMYTDKPCQTGDLTRTHTTHCPHIDTAAVTRMMPLTVTSPVSRCCWNTHPEMPWAGTMLHYGDGRRDHRYGSWLSCSDGANSQSTYRPAHTGAH